MTTDIDTVGVSTRAAEVIARMGEHVAEAARTRGNDAAGAASMAINLAVTLGRVFALVAGGGTLWADGDDLSIGGRTSYGLVFGVVFFRNREWDGCEVDGRPLWRHACGAHRAPMPLDRKETCMDYRGDADGWQCFRTSVPVPGEWSIHS